MESVVARTESWRPRIATRLEANMVSIWLLSGGLVLYLAFDGGGYDTVVHSQVSIIVWWIVLFGAAWGLLPAGRPGRTALVGVGLFGAFALWTAVTTTSSLSTERSLADLSLVAGYLGVLVLGLMLHRDRHRGLHHTIIALSFAIVVVAVMALASRLHPGLIPAATQTSSFLPGSEVRLAWPLNYWNALAAFFVLGLPMLVGLASSARALKGQALAAGAIPLLVLAGYLTFSRGAALAAGVALIAFLALAPERPLKLATLAIAAGGSAVLIASAAHRPALEHGLANAAARHEGATLLVPMIFACLGVALAQVAIGLVARHGTTPRWVTPSPRRAGVILIAGVLSLVLAAMAIGVPGHISHAWTEFKHPRASALGEYSVSRFGTISGNGRYDLWKVAVQTSQAHLLAGSGPGTFQLLWLPRAPYFQYVQNAHSLYLETLAELGIVGLALLMGFFALVLGTAIRLVMHSKYEQRTRAAAAAATLSAFMVACVFDWHWQVPVLPVTFLLIAAAILAPSRQDGKSMPILPRRVLRGVFVLIALACLAAVAVPLATTNALRASQTAAFQGRESIALRDAQQAARIEPGAASPQIQIALLQELRADVPAAIAAAEKAASAEPLNWTTWLILSRLEAEANHPQASLADFERARSLNPRSSLFANA
jgi:O-Antigen ligase